MKCLTDIARGGQTAWQAPQPLQRVSFTKARFFVSAPSATSMILMALKVHASMQNAQPSHFVWSTEEMVGSSLTFPLLRIMAAFANEEMDIVSFGVLNLDHLL